MITTNIDGTVNAKVPPIDEPECYDGDTSHDAVADKPEGYVSDYEECYRDDVVEERQRIQELIDQSVAIGRHIGDALSNQDEEELDDIEDVTLTRKIQRYEVSHQSPQAAKREKTDTEQSQEGAGSGYVKRENYKTGEVKYLPTQSMTGVDPQVARTCAAISGQFYTAKSAGDFDLTNDKIGHVEVLKFDDFGKLSETTPPMVITVVDKAMIVGWRGSVTLMDWVLDYAFAPVASRAWLHTAPKIRCQGGFTGLVESYLSQYQAYMIKEIKERNLTELIFTGHSLGGGIAQVAHLYLNGERLSPVSEWSKMTDLTLRCIAFSAPMTTMSLDRHHKQSADFVNNVGKNVANIIYQSDPFPHFYGDLTFINQLVENAIPEITKGLPVHAMFRGLFGLQNRVSNAIENAITSQKDLIAVMRTFRHIGSVIYYAGEHSKPEVYIDKGSGFILDKPRSLLDFRGNPAKLFRDIEYIKSEKVIQGGVDNHLFIITGPGMAYNIKRD